MAKFTKEAVVEKIKNILKTTGGGQEISDRTVNDTLENLMIFANEEVELDSFVAQIQGGLISMNGNMRREVKEKLDAIPKPTPTPIPTPVPIPIPTPEKSELEKKVELILADIEAQKTEKLESQKKVANETKISEAKKLLDTAGAKNKKVVEFALTKLSVTEDMTAEQISTAVLPLYNTEYKELFGDGAPILGASKNTSPEAQKEAQETAKKKVRDLVEKSGIQVPEQK